MEYQDIQNVLNLELTWDELGYYLDYDYNDDINITFFMIQNQNQRHCQAR